MTVQQSPAMNNMRTKQIIVIEGPQAEMWAKKIASLILPPSVDRVSVATDEEFEVISTALENELDNAIEYWKHCDDPNELTGAEAYKKTAETVFEKFGSIPPKNS